MVGRTVGGLSHDAGELLLWRSVPAASRAAGRWDVQTEPGSDVVDGRQRTTSASQAKSVRYWDLAASVDGDYTCGVRMSRADGMFVVDSVARGRWSPADRDRMILLFAKSDGYGVEIVIEQDFGLAGKSVADYLRRMLAGYTVHVDQPTSNKEVRAQPFAAQCEAGNVCLAVGP